MKDTNRPALQRPHHATLARALSCVLLVGITYAATFGAAHSHGHVLSERHASVAASNIGQASLSAENPLHSHSHSHECLICLLQQQLFNGALYKVPTTPEPLSTQLACASQPAAPYFSIAHTPRRGRAPPPASLL